MIPIHRQLAESFASFSTELNTEIRFAFFKDIANELNDPNQKGTRRQGDRGG